MEIADRIRALRESKGWTQEDLANEAGIGTATVSRLERGIIEPRVETLRALCDAFDVTADWLIGEVS